MTTTGTTVDEILAGNGRQHRVQGLLVRREHSQQDHDTGPIAFDDLQVTPAYSLLLSSSSPLLSSSHLTSYHSRPHIPLAFDNPQSYYQKMQALMEGKSCRLSAPKTVSLRAKQE